MNDWLLNLTESRCTEGHWDNDPTTVLSRVLFPLFFLMCVGTTMVLGRRGRNGIHHEATTTAAGTDSGGAAEANTTKAFPEPTDAVVEVSTTTAGVEPADAYGEATTTEGGQKAAGPSREATTVTATAAAGGPAETESPEEENVSGSVRSVLVMLSPRGGAGGPAQRPNKERMWYLDFARIVCVSAVVVEHSGAKSYSANNVEFVLQWVLPFLWITSGVCFSLSSTPLWFYVARLLVVLVVGVGANLVADVIKGRDWMGDPGNTVFQMFYVVVMIVLAVFTAPLRRGLKWRRENPAAEPSWKLGGLALLPSGVCLFGFWLFVSGQPLFVLSGKSGWAHQLQLILDNSGAIIASTGGVLSLCSLACVVRTGSWFGWVLLAAIFFPRVLMPFAGVGFAHNVDLYFLGMVVQQFRLAGHKAIAAWGRSYWPIMFAALMFLGMPNTKGRCDLTPSDWWWERFRYYLIEAVLVVAFVTGSFNTSDPLKVTAWLNYWAVYAYCTHVAWYRLLPVPWGAIVTYSSALLFYLGHRWRRRRSRDAATG